MSIILLPQKAILTTECQNLIFWKLIFTQKKRFDNIEMKIIEILKVAPEAVQVFRELGIVYQSNDQISFEEACRQRNVSGDLVKNKLKTLSRLNQPHNQVSIKPLSQLAKQIHAQHSIIKDLTGKIVQSIRKVVLQYGSYRPELRKIEKLFEAVVNELEIHLYTEENILFPAIQNMAKDKKEKSDDNVQVFPFKYPIEVMENEHEAVIAYMDKIRVVCRGYRVPSGVDLSFHLLYDRLKNLDKFLKSLIHIENHVLYPSVLQLEEEFLIMSNRKFPNIS